MSEVMNQLGRTQDEVRRLSSDLDRMADNYKRSDRAAHALQAEVQELTDERNRLREVRDSLQEELRIVRGEVDRLSKARDEVQELADRYTEHVRATWQVLDGGAPITTGLAGAVLERLRAKPTHHHAMTDETRRDVWTRMVDAYNNAQGNGQEERMAAVLDEVEAYLSPSQVVVTVEDVDRERLLDRMRAAYRHNRDGMAHALAVVEGEFLPATKMVTVEEVEQAASEAALEASDFRVALDVAKRRGWLSVTVPPAER